MRKFFKWLFKIFRPNPSGYVKNIQDGGAKEITKDQGSARVVKKTVSEKDSFYWLPAKKIQSVNKNDQGLTTSIKISPGFEFFPISYRGKHSLKIKKQGLSRVNYHLELSLETGDKLAEAAGDFISEKKNVSILHIDKYGDGFLYGESQGLGLLEFEGGKMVLEGVEDNVFYEITRECVQSTVPAKE